MLVAAELHRSTGEARWAELWRESAAWLEDERDPESGVWTQVIVGKPAQYLGPAHGFAGCMLALAAFGSSADLHERAADVARRYAVEEDGLANWPPLADNDLQAPDGQKIRVQWCHGAPGIVSSLAKFAPDDPEHDRLLRAGGELTWRAGPLAKGAGLCHGTAGNGYAFLALLERTGDELWLDRARAFAMHAAAQVARAREAHGRGRFTLWTGDPGVALYLADCLAAVASCPALARPAREQVEQKRAERRRDAEEPDRRQLDGAELALRDATTRGAAGGSSGEEAASRARDLRRRDEHELWADRLRGMPQGRCECHVHGRTIVRNPNATGIPLSGECGREDSNLQGLAHRVLNPARLPVPPHPRADRIERHFRGGVASAGGADANCAA